MVVSREPNIDNEFDCDLGMVIDMLENILETRSMDLVSITLLMVIVMRGHGMKVESKATVCIHSEMENEDVVNGMVVPLSILCSH